MRSCLNVLFNHVLQLNGNGIYVFKYICFLFLSTLLIFLIQYQVLLMKKHVYGRLLMIKNARKFVAVTSVYVFDHLAFSITGAGCIQYNSPNNVLLNSITFRLITHWYKGSSA